jgi:hypothetical protein
MRAYAKQAAGIHPGNRAAASTNRMHGHRGHAKVVARPLRPQPGIARKLHRAVAHQADVKRGAAGVAHDHVFGQIFGFNFAGTYLDAKYRNFVFRGLGGAEVNLKGFRLARAPEVSLTTQLVYDRWAVGSRWEGSARAELNYRTSQLTTVGAPVDMLQGQLAAQALVNFVLDFTPVDKKGFGVFLNARNLFDKRYYEYRGDGGLLGGTIARGRTFEVGVRANF